MKSFDQFRLNIFLKIHLRLQTALTVIVHWKYDLFVCLLIHSSFPSTIGCA